MALGGTPACSSVWRAETGSGSSPVVGASRYLNGDFSRSDFQCRGIWSSKAANSKLGSGGWPAAYHSCFTNLSSARLPTWQLAQRFALAIGERQSEKPISALAAGVTRRQLSDKWAPTQRWPGP